MSNEARIADDDSQQPLGWFDAHRTQFTDDLLRWVSIPSVSDETAGTDGAPYGQAVADMFAQAARTAAELGFASRNHEGYAMSVYDPHHPYDDPYDDPYGDPCDEGAGRSASRDIAMVSHLDVVPAGPGWSSDPFTPYERDGYVIGRGADDNKGMALLNLYLLRYWKETGAQFRHPLRVMYGGAEETGLDDMRQYVARHGAPYQAIITDCGFPVNVAQKGEITLQLAFPKPHGIVALTAGASANAVPGEATLVLEFDDADDSACTVAALENAASSGAHDERDAYDARDSHDGRDADASPASPARVHAVVDPADPVRVTVAATGKSGHAAFPEGTVNALNVLAEASAALPLDADAHALLASLAAWSQSPYGTGFAIDYTDDESGRTTANIGLVGTDGDRIAVTIDIRHAVTQDPQNIVDAIAAAARTVGGQVVSSEIDPPYVVDRNDPRVTLLTDVYNRILGTHAEPYAMGGGTHARVIPNAINFGPGLPATPELVAAGKVAPAPDFIHGGAHGANEWVSIDRLRTAFLIYAQGIPELDRQLP